MRVPEGIFVERIQHNVLNIRQKYKTEIHVDHLLWLRYSGSNCWYNFPIFGSFPVKNPWWCPSEVTAGGVL